MCELCWFFYCDAICLVRQTSYSISLTFKYPSTATILILKMILWNRVCPSFCFVVCQGVFFGIGSLNFCTFWHGARGGYEIVCDNQSFWWNIFLLQKFVEMVQKRPKVDFCFNLKKNLVFNFHWICCIIKNFIICFVPTQIPY